MGIYTEFDDFDGSMINIDAELITKSDYKTDDNPILNAFRPHVNPSVGLMLCPFDERLEFIDPRLNYRPHIYISGGLMEWYNDYHDNKDVSEITLCVYRLDEEEVENMTGYTIEEDEEFVIERMNDLWVGVAGGPYALGE